MSATDLSKIDSLLEWLEENAFWNGELLEIRPSVLGGIGVFWRLGPEADPENDDLLLRIPKTSILSPKNSFIYSLLVDHVPEDETIDLTLGMFAIVVTFVYELAMGEKSPWHAYLSSFAFSDQDVPLCLWNESLKNDLRNTECDLLNMLDSSELAAFYKECVNFASKNGGLVGVPVVFQSVSPENFESKLNEFGRYVKAVISRAFTVDKFHGLALVPGADLFNHLSPVAKSNGRENRENVHFVCDDDDELCASCGEIGCEHESEDSELDDSLDEDEDMLGEELQDAEEESHDTSSDSESGESGDEDINDNLSQTASLESDTWNDKQEITMQDIADFENESEADTDHDEEELSTISLEDERPASQSAHQQELSQALSDGSKCCDIVMVSRPSKDHDYELFNTYGNELSNACLLQRYGFVQEDNPNTTCLLSVPMFSHLEAMRKSRKVSKELDQKLEWYELIGFDLVNELSSGHDHEEHADEDDSHECCTEALPESWQLSPIVRCDGTVTKQTAALLRLIQFPLHAFTAKLANASSERKLEKRILHLLLGEELSAGEAQILRKWVQQRLAKYNSEAADPRIQSIIRQEKAVLNRALATL